MRNFFAELSVLFRYGQSSSLLLARWALAFGFLGPLTLKIENLPETGIWFEKLGIPLPHFFAYVVTGVEAIGVILLVLGLMTRYISLAMGTVMLVAIFAVHWKHGFSAADQGFEIPLYYLLFFLILMAFGAGKYSLDYLLFEKAEE